MFTTENKWLDMMLHELGMTPHEWACERARFEASPRQWMIERFAKLGYVPAAAVERLLATKQRGAA